MRRTFPIASVLSRSLQPWPSKKPKNGCVILVVRPRAILHRLRSDGLRVVILLPATKPCRLPFASQTEACPVSRLRLCVVIVVAHRTTSPVPIVHQFGHQEVPPVMV